MPVQINIVPDEYYTREELELLLKGGNSDYRAVYKISTLRRYGLRAHGIYYKGENALDSIMKLRQDKIACGGALAGKEFNRERKQQEASLFEKPEAQDERLHPVRNQQGMGSLMARFERKVSQIETA